MSDITLAKEIFPTDKKLIFAFSDKQETMKFEDKLIKYFVLTTLITVVMFIAKDIKQKKTIIELYNFLNSLSEELYKFRNIDKILIGLEKEIKDIITSKDSTDNKK